MGKNSVWKKPERKDEQVVRKNRIFGRKGKQVEEETSVKESSKDGDSRR